MTKLGFFALLLLLVSCDKVNDTPLTLTEELAMQELMLSLESFQWQLFQEVVERENTLENLNISPLSIGAALYMTYEGAANETRVKIQQTLKLPAGEAVFNLGQSYKNFITELEKTSSVLTTSNAIFWDKTRMSPSNQFLEYTRQYFDAGQFDLTFHEPSALSTINDWVKSSTQGRIEKILDEIAAEEIMFIINALYFKDDWKYPFAEENSRTSAFTRTDGSLVQAEMMHQDVFNLKSYRGTDFSAVELPFADTAYSMVLLLPSPAMTPDQLIALMTGDRLKTLFDRDLTEGRILLDVPRFEIEYKILLNEVLKSMGMEIAFDPGRADFSNLGRAPEGNLYISKVNHKTYLKIDEKGAEGAAVTSVGVGVTSSPPQMLFDRPFVFMIRNRITQTLIFAGKVEDPTSK